MDSRSLCMPVAQKFFRFLERARDNVDGYKFSDAARCSGTRIECGLDGTNIAANKHCNIAVEKVFLANKHNIGRLDHGVRRLNRSDQAKCFNHSQCFHEVRNLPESLYKSN